MKKKILYKHDFSRGKLLSKGEDATVIKLNNGNILKIFHPETISISKECGVDIEAKILDAVPIKHSPEILVPSVAAYYENGAFLGYIMPPAQGINFNLYDQNLTLDQRKNLKRYADIHYKLESVLRRNEDIVFPDFCTCDNIFVDKKSNIQFIDYDGLQIGKHGTLSLSTSLGDIHDIIKNPKYFNQEHLYTKELDKRSSIILYFLCALNVNFTKIGQIDPTTGKPVTLDDIFNAINLDDLDICHKVWKIFQDNEKNEYLGDDVYKMADIYDLNLLIPYNGYYIKKLSRKK